MSIHQNALMITPRCFPGKRDHETALYTLPRYSLSLYGLGYNTDWGMELQTEAGIVFFMSHEYNLDT